MVNVPGRSKGCKTCRKRKIKCSLERPKCLQCKKSNRECLGYQRETVFVHSGFAPETKKARNQPIKQNDIESNCLPVGLCSQIALHSEAHVDDSIGLSYSMGLIAASMRQQLLSTYASTSAASGIRAWITYIPSIPFPTQALETAASAVSLAKLGAALDSPDIRQESLKLYTQGLFHVQRALWNRTLTDVDEILGACMLLAVYEVFECPSKSKAAFHSHFHGCAKLVQLQGPSMFTEGFAHALFQAFRFMGALEGLRTKSTFLSDPVWKSLPFSKFSKKAPLQRVLDVLLEGSTILRKADHLPNISKEKRVPFVVDLIQNCLLLDGEMQEFLLDFEISQGGLLYWPGPSKQVNLTQIWEESVENNDFFDSSYEFPDHPTGTIMMLSWGTLTILWSGICHLYEFLSQETTMTPTLDGKLAGHVATPGDWKFELPEPSRFKGFPTMAQNVCQAVDFCLRDEWGIPAMIAPLNMVIDAWSSWPGFEREIAWAKNMLDLIESKGMKMVKYIRES